MKNKNNLQRTEKKLLNMKVIRIVVGSLEQSQEPGKEVQRTGDKKKNWSHLDHSTDKIGSDT